MDVTVAGLPLEGENDIMQPLDAVVCIKGLDAEGKVAYYYSATNGITTAEAIGMTVCLLDELRGARGAD